MATRSPLNHRRPWSADEEALLFNLAKENTPARLIALQLQRTPDSIYDRASALRIPLDWTHQRRPVRALGPFAFSQPVKLTHASGRRARRRVRSRARRR
jgi:hypothetical protein